jgi:lipopolysaccharide export system permease protein
MPAQIPGMKKIDKLILQAFIGPLILTFLVVVFILLTRHMLYYFDDIIGKDLGPGVLMQFLLYFAILMIPAAMPLAVLLASLITFGDLAEHFELTAIKSTGISLPRVLRPIFFLVLCLTAVAFYANNYLVPKASLEAFSLLHDIKQKKPAMDIREGIFYDGLPDISIKVNRKFAHDPAALKDIILYDHRAQDGSTEVTVADSGRMFTILNARYLKVELFKGYQYSEVPITRSVLTTDAEPVLQPLSRRAFSRIEMVYDLSSFSMTRTDSRLFETNYRMRNMEQLAHDIDSMKDQMLRRRIVYQLNRHAYFSYHGKNDPVILPSDVQFSKVVPRVDSLIVEKPSLAVLQAATNKAREVKSNLQSNNMAAENNNAELSVFRIQEQKIPASALACVVMFLIGAPLGAIIRKGGLGLPFLVSIFFFIVYTLLGMHGEKLARQGMLGVITGTWGANLILLATGFFFLRIARDDGRLFDGDALKMALEKMIRGVAKSAVKLLTFKNQPQP